MKETFLNSRIRGWLIFPRIVFSLFILVIVLALPLIMISGSESFYRNRLVESDCYSLISEKDCVDLSMNVLNYLKGEATLDGRYSDREQSHFADVKIILDFAKALVLGLFLFVVLYFAVFLYLDGREILRTLRLSGWMIVIFFALLLIAISVSFKGTFFFFHVLLFPQGNWTFPFDFTIITVFPEQFFVRAVLSSFLFSLGTGLALLGVSFLGTNKKKRRYNLF